MAENDKKKSSGEQKRKVNVPVVSYLVRLTIKMLYVALFAGFICLLIEFAMYAANQDAGYQPAYDRYESIASGVFRNSSPLLNEASVLNVLTDKVRVVISNKPDNSVSGYVEMARESTNNFEYFPIQKITVSLFQKLYGIAPNVLMIWLFVTLGWVAKMLSILAMSVPYILILTVGIIDGAASRKIEMFKGARDSIDRLEYWLYLSRSIFYLTFFFFLAIPNSNTAYIFMVPAACISAFMARKVIMHFKKYG